MNWDDDFDISSNSKKAQDSSNPRSPESVDDLIAGDSHNSPPDIPIRTRKTGGWADDGPKSAKGKGPNLIEQERFQSQKLGDTDEDIPVIPDIDDIQDDLLNLPDVKVPNVTVKQSTYRELDTEPSFRSGGDVDLSILTSAIFPEKEIERSTEIWTVESLFQEFVKKGG